MKSNEIIKSLREWTPSTLKDDIELLENLQKVVEEMKTKQSDFVREHLGGQKEISFGDIKLQRIDVFEKVADLDQINQKFVKTEKRLNTAVVNEYLKENKTLPEGVTEYKKYSRFCMKVIKPIESKEKGKFKVVEGSQKAIDNLKSLSKNIKTRGTDKAESNLPF